MGNAELDQGGAGAQVTTLDALIGKYGAPAFIKIDVEGWSKRRGDLTHAVKALSCEFTTIQRDVALPASNACHSRSV